MHTQIVSQDTAPSPKRGKRGRKPKGRLIPTAAGFSGRFWTAIDGERVRVTVDLGTRNRAAATVKLKRLVDEGQAAIAALAATGGTATGTTRTAIKSSAKRTETFNESMERVYVHRAKIGRDCSTDLPLLRRLAVPIIGDTAAADVTTSDINLIYDAIQADGLEVASCDRVKYALRAVFKQLKREGVAMVDPTIDAVFPSYEKTVTKERATLTDEEFTIYIEWPGPRRYGAFAAERKTMACVSRMFGGLRIGDIVALGWESFDAEGGRFEHGYAPREKTKQPQKLVIPDQLRPILRQWWVRSGKPTKGLMFPARRGKTAGQKRSKYSCAVELRIDLKAAFTAAALASDPDAPRPDTRRWTELFTETAYTLPVDFHSFRRAFCQALADAGASLQVSMALTGHASPKTHARYLRASHKARAVPDAALPRLGKKAPNKGTGADSEGAPVSFIAAADAKDTLERQRAPRGEWSLPRSLRCSSST